MHSTIQRGKISRSFCIKYGVKQVCILLHSLLFILDWVLMLEFDFANYKCQSNQTDSDDYLLFFTYENKAILFKVFLKAICRR